MKKNVCNGGQPLLNKGFTLIELLAVIVILAIIAVIAVPIILNIIDDSKKESDKRSIEAYKKSIKNAIIKYQLEKNEEPTEFSQIESYIEYEGTKVSCKTKKIIKGRLIVDDCIIGELSQSICTLENDADKDGKISIGDKYSCDLGKEESTKNLKFYILEIGETTTLDKWDGTYPIYETDNVGTTGKGTDKVALIMDRNIENAHIDWITQKKYQDNGGIVTDEMKNDYGSCQWSGNCVGNTLGPLTAITKLPTSEIWAKLENSQITMPTYNQIYKINNNDSLRSNIWLYDYLDSTEHSVDGLYGYWTMSATSNNQSFAWFVNCYGSIESSHVSDSRPRAIRPVITISKSNLS